jgi:hypothetical protein
MIFGDVGTIRNSVREEGRENGQGKTVKEEKVPENPFIPADESEF